jgi:DNA segregation ATPase FtsK/SpoIIIE, S-DNA-T family
MIEGLKLLALDILKVWLIAIGGLFLILVIKNGAVEIAIESLKINSIMLSILLVLSILIISIYYFINWKYIIMPYCLKLISQPKAENKEVSVFLDKFIWYDRKKNILYYKNRNAIDIQLYKDKQREIIHFLGLYNKSIELDIQPFKSKWVKIEIYKLPYSFDFDIGKLRRGYLYYGSSKDGDYYKKLDEQTSMITVAESGAGKSNLLNLLLYSIFWNYNDIHNSNIDYTILIDLKGNELSLYNYKNTRFIDNIEGVADIFKELKELMSNRYNQMKEKGDKTFKGLPIIVVIDEVGTIGTHYDKKLRDAIFNDMIELFQKGRACKIIFMIFAQKCDSTNIPSNVLTNIQSRVLMKTDSDFNTNAMIGTKETIEEITLKEVANFNRGRAIIKDGTTSQKELFQVPYISEHQHLSIIKVLNYLK